MKCYYCKRNVVDGLSVCDKHRDSKNKDRRVQTKKRKEMGLCIGCGGKKENKRYSQCERCRDIQKKNYIKRFDYRKNKNLCVSCGRSNSIISCWTNIKCPGCHVKEKFKWRGCKEEAEQIINDLLVKQKFECALTGRSLLDNKFHIDHIIPRSIAPEKINDKNNWQLVVENANIFKNDMLMIDIIMLSKDIVIKDGILCIDEIY